jgi:chromosome segregation ATPase
MSSLSDKEKQNIEMNRVKARAARAEARVGEQDVEIVRLQEQVKGLQEIIDIKSKALDRVDAQLSAERARLEGVRELEANYKTQMEINAMVVSRLKSRLSAERARLEGVGDKVLNRLSTAGILPSIYREIEKVFIDTPQPAQLEPEEEKS